MLSLFKKKPKNTPLYISRTTLDHPDSYDLVSDVAEFWDRYSDEDFVRPQDLPDGVFDISCALDYYGGVLNGGHAQFLANSDFDTSRYDNIARVLRDTGNTPMLTIFETFRKLSGPAPHKALFDDPAYLDDLTELNRKLYDLQKGEFDFYVKTANWIRTDLNVVATSADEVEQHRRALPSTLPGFHDYKLGAYLDPLVQSLSDTDLGHFQATVSGMRIRDKPVFVSRVNAVPRPDSAPAHASRIYALKTNIASMDGIRTDTGYEAFQRSQKTPAFDKSLTAGTAKMSDINALLQHAQRHDPVLVAHLLLERGDALSGLKHIAFYYTAKNGPEPQHGTLSYMVQSRSGKTYRLDVSELGMGLCEEGVFDTTIASLRGRDLSQKMRALRTRYRTYTDRRYG
ncbi:DMP19 family protein [Celeribacter arenosi]|uniref:DNA mimic protein DMP19 C-terminal domain-containing protein n=1 Tax=Celeribacter arenosi TaxID=792649 RepID=A0ABP7JW20_9RHOB